MEFADILKEFSGLDLKEDFKKWVYSGETVGGTTADSDWVLKKHKVEIIPPNVTQTKGEN